MNAQRATPAPSRWPDYARWSACFALALCFHAAGAAVLLARWSEESDLVANAPIIIIDLAPMPVAPDITPTELPPDQVQSQAQPEPVQEKPVEKTEIEPEPVPEKSVEKIEIPPEPVQQAELSVMPPPKPIEKPVEKKEKKKPHKRPASLASAPSTAEQRAERAAAPMAGARSTSSIPNWKSQLVAQLERHKRYPSEAQARGDHGVAQLAFSVDRGGGVHHARIVRSSGSSLLDLATLALLARAAPLPPPPPDLPGSQIAIVVPIRYNMR